MNRLFTFGCSFTEYDWPTWADILGRDFDYYENWGKCGGGNQYIFNSLIEANSRNKFTDNDTIIIMWTNVVREDYYLKGTWRTQGNVYSRQSTYDEEFIKKFSDNRGFLIRDLATVTATVELLDHWKVKYHLLSMVPLTNLDQYRTTRSRDNDVIALYSSAVDKVKPSVYEVVFDFDWNSRNWSGKNRLDKHPIPSEHLEYIEKVLPGYSISDATREWVKQYDILAQQSATREWVKQSDSVGSFEKNLPKDRL